MQIFKDPSPRAQAAREDAARHQLDRDAYWLERYYATHPRPAKRSLLARILLAIDPAAQI